jgi:hypothetical protein
MASYNSDLISKAAAARLKQANGVVDGDDKGGNVLYATTKVVLTGAEAATDAAAGGPAEWGGHHSAAVACVQ